MEIRDDSFLKIFLEKWIPALITAVLGGLFIAFIVPVVQTKYTEISKYKEKQLSLWEITGENFTKYIISRSNLNSVARTQLSFIESNQPVEKELLKSKAKYLKKRDEYGILLRHNLLMCEHMFDQKVGNEIKRFLAWHAKFVTAEISDQPPDEDYVRWREKILAVIARELQGQLKNG